MKSTVYQWYHWPDYYLYFSKVSNRINKKCGHLDMLMPHLWVSALCNLLFYVSDISKYGCNRLCLAPKVFIGLVAGHKFVEGLLLRKTRCVTFAAAPWVEKYPPHTFGWIIVFGLHFQLIPPEGEILLKNCEKFI